MDKDNINQSVKRSNRTLVPIFALILMLFCAVGLIYSGYMHYDIQLENEAELLRTSAGQAATGLELKFEKLEDASVTLLVNEEYMSFDAAYYPQDEYETSQTLAELSKNVTALSLIDNYCDFAIIYRNDSTAGRLSSDTKDMLNKEGSSIYAVLQELLNGERRRWITGVSGSYDKVFYISQANDHALFLGGFYTDELRYSISPADKSDGSKLILLDSEGHAVLSPNGPVEGELPDKIHGDSFALIEDDSVQASATLKNGWRVIIFKDMTDTVEQYKKLALEISVVLILVFAVFIVIYAINSGSEALYGGTSVISPEVDMLTGIINAEEAENIMADRLETCVSGSTIMLALARITNLPELEKKYGRSGYNGAIIKTYRGLAEFFGIDDPTTENLLGRTGDGEFMVLADYTQYDLFKANDNLREGLVELSESLNSIFIATEGDIHICVGAAVYPHNSTDYDTLYDMAEAALNEAIGDDEKSYALYKKEKGANK